VSTGEWDNKVGNFFVAYASLPPLRLLALDWRLSKFSTVARNVRKASHGETVMDKRRGLKPAAWLQVDRLRDRD
jgi:hypothetical protein